MNNIQVVKRKLADKIHYIKMSIHGVGVKQPNTDLKEGPMIAFHTPESNEEEWGIIQDINKEFFNTVDKIIDKNKGKYLESLVKRHLGVDEFGPKYINLY